MNEKELTTKFSAFLKARNYIFYKTPQVSRSTLDNGKLKTFMSARTFPDFLIFVKGPAGVRTIFVELKGHSAELSPTQNATCARLWSIGGVVYVMHPTSWDDFLAHYKFCGELDCTLTNTCRVWTDEGLK